MDVVRDIKEHRRGRISEYEKAVPGRSTPRARAVSGLSLAMSRFRAPRKTKLTGNLRSCLSKTAVYA